MPQRLVVSEAQIRRRQRLAGVLAILVGPFGAHKFVLGYYRAGFIMLLAPVVVIPAGWLASTAVSLVMGIIGLIEGWRYLAQSPQAFKAHYIDAKKEWF
ncbi:MAG: TM2 domain-containing protein [Synechococcaceae bacterium WB9_2_170]|nr:TM2 domain-containing protein [Synechococcaceae bacterium WB9_2_170]